MLTGGNAWMAAEQLSRANAELLDAFRSIAEQAPAAPAPTPVKPSIPTPPGRSFGLRR